jgi:hypothetical protein
MSLLVPSYLCGTNKKSRKSNAFNLPLRINQKATQVLRVFEIFHAIYPLESSFFAIDL